MGYQATLLIPVFATLWKPKIGIGHLIHSARYPSTLTVPPPPLITSVLPFSSLVPLLLFECACALSPRFPSLRLSFFSCLLHHFFPCAMFAEGHHLRRLLVQDAFFPMLLPLPLSSAVPRQLSGPPPPPRDAEAHFLFCFLPLPFRSNAFRHSVESLRSFFFMPRMSTPVSACSVYV